MIRDKITRLRRRPGELGRLLDTYAAAPGATLRFEADGRRCQWVLGGLTTPLLDARAITAEAAAAGMTGQQLADALARIDDPVWRRHLERAAGRPVVEPSPAEVARVAARQVWPSLHVRRSPLSRRWCWQVLAPDGRPLAPMPDPTGETVGVEYPSQPAALEVGLANLAAASASWALDVLGAELPPGFERILPAA